MDGVRMDPNAVSGVQKRPAPKVEAKKSADEPKQQPAELDPDESAKSQPAPEGKGSRINTVA